MRDLSPSDHSILITDTPPSSPLMTGGCKEVSYIQVAVTYTDGSTVHLRSKSPTSFVAPMSPPDSENDKDEEMLEQDTSSNMGGFIFEPQEVKTFPQASGYLNTDNIFVVTKNTDREALLPEQEEPLCLKVSFEAVET